jgi:3-deoxy-7-phosphoheptulonate synthase
MIPKTRYGHRTDAKRSDGGTAPDGTVPRTIPFGQRISGLAADSQELHAPVSDENEVITDVTRRVVAEQRRMTRTSDTRITGYEPLLSPAALLDELPLSEAATATVAHSRAEVRAVLDGSGDRLLVIAGPCSVHDTRAALEYAGRLREARERHRHDLLIVMRVYFEKPRTVTGWKGLINDPGMDGGHDVHRGLGTARRFLLDVVGLGLPVGCEWLDPITPQYIADAVTWGAIGARTTESQVHRQLASGLSMPVGFKNGTDGDVQVAVDACRAAAAGHTFFGVTPNGVAAVVTTAGNPDTHVILRGGRSGPNYGASHTAKALDLIGAAGLPRRLMVDASHGNSGKDHRRQPVVTKTIAEQVAAGERGLTGVMLESFLQEGNQEPGPPATLTYGQSVTDACLDFDTTATVLDGLAAAVRSRRKFYAERISRAPRSPHHGQPGEGLVDPLLRHLEQPEFVHP